MAAMVLMETDANVYRQLLPSFTRTGQPPTPKSIASALGLISAQIAESLKLLESGGSLYRDPQTRTILAAYPFSARPTPHVVRFEDSVAICSQFRN